MAISSGTQFPVQLSGLWRSFSTIVSPAQTPFQQAQAYAVAQTTAMGLSEPNLLAGTYNWALPIMLTELDGSGANVWIARNYSAQDGINGITDVLAVSWNSSWVIGVMPANFVNAYNLLDLFTGTEKTALLAAVQVQAIAQFVQFVKAAGIVDTTQAEVTSGFAALVSAGVLTQARATALMGG